MLPSRVRCTNIETDIKVNGKKMNLLLFSRGVFKWQIFFLTDKIIPDDSDQTSEETIIR